MVVCPNVPSCTGKISVGDILKARLYQILFLSNVAFRFVKMGFSYKNLRNKYIFDVFNFDTVNTYNSANSLLAKIYYSLLLLGQTTVYVRNV